MLRQIVARAIGLRNEIGPVPNITSRSKREQYFQQLLLSLEQCAHSNAAPASRQQVWGKTE
jgi:hypothetical protein